jgi:predicted transcriptional regulator
MTTFASVKIKSNVKAELDKIAREERRTLNGVVEDMVRQRKVIKELTRI